MPTVAAEITDIVWKALDLCDTDTKTLYRFGTYRLYRCELEMKIQHIFDTGDYPSLSGEKRLNELLRQYRDLTKAQDMLLAAYRVHSTNVGAVIDVIYATKAMITELETEPAQ